MDKKVGVFSKGMKHRFGLAQAIVHDPPVLFFDEPTAGIDPQGAEDYRDLVAELKGKGKTIFMISHILQEIEAVCDRIGIIVDGEMNACGTMDEIIDQHTRQRGYHIRLRVKDLDEAHAIQSLSAVQGITNVARHDGYYLIDAGEDVSEDVSRAVCHTNGVVTGLDVARPTLNEIFLDITRPAQRADTANK